jgi:tetratricopeptide (TPR) repeat protein
MRLVVATLVLALLGASPARAADALAEARRLYNLGQYDGSIKYAREALKMPATAESARVVLGRAQLERYRATADAADLVAAREALKMVNAGGLEPRERAELSIGIGECLFLEDKFGPASESFGRVLDSSRELGTAAHARVLDWWASSLDRLALSRAREHREPLYARIVEQMDRELATNPSSAPAAYWLAAALRGLGDVDRAWYAASAGWVQAMLAADRGAALRADLDRLVVQAIIPERAGRLQPRDPTGATAVMTAEWDALKAAWSR